MWKKSIISVAVIILFILVVRSVYSVPQTQVKLAPSALPSPKITEIDTRDQKQVDAFNSYFEEYCKTNDCNTPEPTPSIK